MPASTAPSEPRPRPGLALLGWMESLADPTRLRLLRLLERHELGVAELTEVLQLPQSTVSRHLKVLADQGWVMSRPDGTNRLYRTTGDGRDPGARKLWLLARDQTEAWPTARQDALRLERRLSAREESEAEAFFAGAAGEWDRLRAELYGTAFTQSALLSMLPRAWTVVDLGCGTGHVAAALSPHVARVVGVDRSAAMLKAAARRTSGLGNVELRRGSLEAAPLEDASADAALLILALSYVPDPAAALAEMARILRPGGRAVVLDLLRHDREEFRRRLGQHCLGFDEAELEARLASAGFDSIHCRALPPDPQAKGPALVLASAERSQAHNDGRRGR
jgi:SAM-dependent methyltransferase